MKNRFKKIILVFVLMTIAVISNVKAGYIEYTDKNFPDSLQSLGNTDYPGGYANWNGANIPFKWWNSSNGKIATYCTMLQLSTHRGPCFKSDTWSEAVRAGVASIIMDANADNNYNTVPYYYAEEAINLFLYHFDDHNTNHLQYWSNDNISQLGNYKSYYNNAVKAYNKVKDINNEKIDLIRTDNVNTKRIQSNIDGITYKLVGNADSYTVSYEVDEDLPDNVNVVVKVGNEIINSGTKKMENVAVNSNITISITGLVDHLGEFTDNGFTIKINAKGSSDYYVAQNYYCASGYQSFTPNIVQKKVNEKDITKSVTFTTYFAPDYPTLQLTKLDSSNNDQRLKGATFKIVKDGSPYTTEVTNENGVIDFGSFLPGEYCITETLGPKGYVYDRDDERCFTVALNQNEASVTVTKGELSYDQNNHLITTTYRDNITKLKIAKVDKEDHTKYLTGATLKLVNYLDIVNYDNLLDAPAVELNGEPLIWQTDGQPKEITGLPIGFYWLVETKAPDGYIINDVSEVVWVGPYNQSDNMIKITNYENERSYVTISKVDITNKEELPGATLRLLDENGNVVQGDLDGDGEIKDLVWESTTEKKVIRGLNPGTYYLEETQAPEGYAKMTEKIKFSLDEYGRVTIDESTDDGSVVIMTNAHTKVYISKQDITTKEELPGAHLQLLNEYGKVIHEWDSTTEPEYIEGLAVGTYTLIETTAPDGYSLNTESVTFTLNEDGTVTGDTVMYNTPIPDVPNTLSTKSILITLGGVAIISLGVGLYLNGFKKKEEC